tara:strand:+ start:54 stop:242 length:189 start_codon:yes stop_codon:yes gene_type:complete
MTVYLKRDGSKVLSLTDEEFENLRWEEGTLLELEYDSIGWTIQQSKVAAGKVIGGKLHVEKT